MRPLASGPGPAVACAATWPVRFPALPEPDGPSVTAKIPGSVVFLSRFPEPMSGSLGCRADRLPAVEALEPPSANAGGATVAKSNRNIPAGDGDRNDRNHVGSGPGSAARGCDLKYQLCHLRYFI